MKHSRIIITFQIMLFLSPLFTGYASVSLDFSQYYKLPRFKNYSGEDAAYIFIAYRDNLRYGINFHESGSSVLILDGKRTAPSRYLKKLQVKPGKHKFKIQGKRKKTMDPSFGYDPVNYPKLYYSKVVKIKRKMKKGEVWMLLMFWYNRKYSYYLIPLGTLDGIKPAPLPKPGMKMKIGGREVSYFVLKAFHNYSVEIADKFKKLKL